MELSGSRPRMYLHDEVRPARARAGKAKSGGILIENSTTKSLLRGVARFLFVIAMRSFFVGG